jgi:hypothetical protein
MKLLELSNNTAKISSKVAEDELLKLLKHEARNSYDAIRRQPIFTKVDTKEPYFVVDPAKAGRTSKFLIDSLVTMLPSWRGWTSRLESVRGWTSRETAESRGGGKLCVLIPFDKARVHSAAATSFYRSFKRAQTKFEIKKVDNDALNDWLESLHKITKFVDDKLPAFVEPTTAAQFMKEVERLESLRESVVKMLNDDLQADRLDLRRAKDAFKDKLPLMLDRAFDPDDNGFHTHTSLYNLPSDREVWTSAKCIVITVEEYEAMHGRGALK